MSLFDQLDKMRARPESERRRMVIWLSILITLILFVLWLLNLRVIWHNSEEPAPIEPVSSAQTGPGFWDRIITGWQTITNQN